MSRSISAVPFKRMMLVDELLLTKLKEDALTGYNPTVKSLIQHKEAMDSALLAGNGGAMADDRRLALLSANDQRFRQLMRDATTATTTAERKVPASAMTSEMVQTEPTQTTTQGVQAETETEPTATLKLESNLARQFSIPQQYEKKFDGVVNLMASRPDIISVSEDNELVVGEKVVRGTSFGDLMRSLFVDSGFPCTGLSQMVAALQHIGVTEEMLSSKKAKETMRSIGMLSSTGKAASKLPLATTTVKKEASAQGGKGKRKRVTMATAVSSEQLPPGKRMRVLRLYK